MAKLQVVISCEHARFAVPAKYRYLFGDKELLASHRGWDPGALDFATELSSQLAVPCYLGEVTRLLVDLNRREPKAIRSLEIKSNPKLKAELLKRYYRPYRSAMLAEVKKKLLNSAVLHLSIHSFTPSLNSIERNADIGLLYDPTRKREVALARSLAGLLRKELGLRVRFNYPYRGIADGHTTALRKAIISQEYVGLEIEINQKLVFAKQWPQTQRSLAEVFGRWLAMSQAP